MIVRCIKCRNEDVIEFVVKGKELQDMVINFKCSKCGLPGTVIIMFSKEGEQKDNKVEWNEVDYIG